MNDSDKILAIQACIMLLSILGGAVAWWQANLSKKAKKQALEAESRANSVAESLKVIAAAHIASDIEIEYRSGSLIYIRNRSLEPFTIEELETDGNGDCLRIELPATVPPQAFARLNIVAAGMGGSLGTTATLKLSDGRRCPFSLQ